MKIGLFGRAFWCCSFFGGQWAIRPFACVCMYFVTDCLVSLYINDFECNSIIALSSKDMETEDASGMLEPNMVVPMQQNVQMF